MLTLTGPKWRFWCGPFAGRTTSGWDVAVSNARDFIANRHKRYADPPPADMNPDPDYKPEVGEWFWYRIGPDWVLRQWNNGSISSDDGFAAYDIHGKQKGYRGYKGNCLPATAPE